VGSSHARQLLAPPDHRPSIRRHLFGQCHSTFFLSKTGSVENRITASPLETLRVSPKLHISPPLATNSIRFRLCDGILNQRRPSGRRSGPIVAVNLYRGRRTRDLQVPLCDRGSPKNSCSLWLSTAVQLDRKCRKDPPWQAYLCAFSKRTRRDANWIIAPRMALGDRDLRRCDRSV